MSNKALELLDKSINDTVAEYVEGWNCEWQKGVPVAVRNPERAKEVLALIACGTNNSQIHKRTGMDSRTVANLKSAFADHLGQWKEWGGGVAGGLFMQSSDTAAEILEKLNRATEEEDWKAVEALSKALQASNKVVEVSHRQSMVARGEATQKIEVKKVATIEDVEAAAAEAMKMLDAEVIDLSEDES